MAGKARRRFWQSGLTALGVVAVTVTLAQAALAATAGPNNPTSATNTTGVGTVAWGSPVNVLASDNARSAAALGGSATSNYLVATGFGFDIPDSATINGITIGVERRRTGSGNILDFASRLVKAGVIQSTDVLSTANWSTTEGYVNRGSTSNLWGTAWLPSDINDPGFGFALSARTTTATAGGADVDHIRATITYTLPVYTQSAYRFFANNNGTSVGSALAGANTVPTLAAQNSQFRLRMLVHVGTATLRTSTQPFKLQFARKGAGTCAAPAEAYADVTGSSAIRYHDNAAPADGAALTTNANDPTHSSHTKITQTYEESNTFTSSQGDIASNQDGLWDFSLSSAGATGKTRYCLRAVQDDGTAFGTYTVYPEVLTGGTSTSADIVDSSGDSVAAPSFDFTNQVTSPSCVTSTAGFGDSGQQIRIANNSTAENWSLALAATGGATSTWNGTLATYDFNDSGGCNDGGDADAVGGRLTVNPAGGTLTPGAGCTATGISQGAQTSFTEGTTNSITLLSGTTGSGTNCTWDLTGVGLSQSIPSERPASSYLINMTLTLTVT